LAGAREFLSCGGYRIRSRDESWIRTVGGMFLVNAELGPWGAKMAQRAWLEQAYRLGKDFAI